MSDTGIRSSESAWARLFGRARSRHADTSGGVRPTFPGEPGISLREEPARDDGGFSTPDSTIGRAGSVFDGRRQSSGRGDRDGSALRPARGRGDRGGPCFAVYVPPSGYAWWYIDGVSDDGTRAISIIAFVGSVFSPWYRWSGRKDPENNVCINVATYGPKGRFAMTDRGRSALRRDENTFTVGPSSLHWDGSRLFIEIDEVSSLPLVSRMQGQIVLTPSGITDVELPLTNDDQHIWRPFAPTARIDVDLGPGWQWRGHGYFDANFGARALEQDFDYWTWGRFPVADGSVCFYDAERRDGTRLREAFRFDASGGLAPFDAPPVAKVRRSNWAVRRETRADPGFQPKQVKAMLDAPFYNRSVVRTKIEGFETDGVHEALDLRRFRGPWLMPMLAVRVPRRAQWTFQAP